MSKRPSLVQQVCQALHHSARIGESRHRAKQEGVAHQFIYSWESLRTHQQRCISALRGLPPEVRPRMLRELTVAHVGAVAGGMRAQGLSQTYIKNTLGSLRKLGYALNDLGWNTVPPDQLVPTELYAGLRRSAPRGSYSASQADRLAERLARDPDDGLEFARMLRLLRASGLRHNEVARLREEDLDREAGTVTVRGANAKGGRPRVVGPTLDDAGRAALREAIDDIPAGRNHLWSDGRRLARRLEDAMREACDELGIDRKGLHGFRALFAQEYIDRRVAAGLSERDARRELMAPMGHSRPNFTYSYVP
jgi:integrase